MCVNRNFVGTSAYPVLSLFTFTVLFTLTNKFFCRFSKCFYLFMSEFSESLVCHLVDMYILIYLPRTEAMFHVAKVFYDERNRYILRVKNVTVYIRCSAA